LIVTNNLAGLSFFLSLGADVEARLPAFDIIGLDGDGFGPESELDPTALLVAADEDNVPLARLLLENGAKVH
jgi:ankyrin repeat protein